MARRWGLQRGAGGEERRRRSARDADLKPVLEELANLSSRAVAAEIERRGLGRFSHKAILRARARLGLKK